MIDPLVSIVIPAFNAERWIGETLRSALTQTWNNREVIVIDDGSTDCTADVLGDFKDEIQVVRQKNHGAAAARNVAYNLSRGSLIQYLDADDILAPDKIEIQVECMRADEFRYLTSGEWARFKSEPMEAVFRPEPLWKTLTAADWLGLALSENLMMHPAAWLVPRRMIETAGPWREDLSRSGNDDGEFFARAVKVSGLVKFCLGARSYYRSGYTSSLSHRRGEQAWRSAFEALDAIATSALSVEDSTRMRNAIGTAYAQLYFDSFPSVPDLRRARLSTCRDHFPKVARRSLSPRAQAVSAILGWRATKILSNAIRSRQLPAKSAVMC